MKPTTFTPCEFVSSCEVSEPVKYGACVRSTPLKSSGAFSPVCAVSDQACVSKLAYVVLSHLTWKMILPETYSLLLTVMGM